jgi:hypothetical protein
VFIVLSRTGHKHMCHEKACHSSCMDTKQLILINRKERVNTSQGIERVEMYFSGTYHTENPSSPFEIRLEYV